MNTPEDFTLEYHPWKYYLPAGATTLVIGTFPTALRNRSFDFFYPNKTNLFWKVLFAVAEKELHSQEDRTTAVASRKAVLDFLQVAITDMGYCIKRYKNSSLDEKLVLMEPMKILNILAEAPTIRKIILTSSSGPVSAARWFLEYLTANTISFKIPTGKKPIATSVTINGKILEVIILYSPSQRAANRISFEKMVEMYQKALLAG
jgi:G:T/U-mismatch repair DNA glycosylase